MALTFKRICRGAITSTSQPHGEELISVDTNEPTEYVSVWDVSRITNDSVRAYLTGTTNAYELHFFGYGEMQDYNSSTKPPWQNYKPGIKKIAVHDGITYVGRWIYRYDASSEQGLTVEISDTVRAIGEGAFQSDKVNKTISLGNGVRCLYNASLSSVSIVQQLSIQIPAPVKQIGSSAFNNTTFFTQNTDTWFIVGDGVLIKCNNSTSAITIPSGVKSVCLPYYASPNNTTVANSGRLTAINFSQAQVENLFINALGNNSITVLDLPSTLKSIGINAFLNNPLRKVWIPSSVEYIGGAKHLSMTTAMTPFAKCNNSALKIFCETQSKPEGWYEYWNYYDATHPITVVWGATHAEFEAY